MISANGASNGSSKGLDQLYDVMTRGSFYEEGSKLLKPGAFEFVLDSELKRAVRSQNYLTLVVVEVRREWEETTITADDGTLKDIAQIIGSEIRDTDLLAHTDEGTLTLALLDTGFEESTKVVDRVVSRMDRQGLPAALRLVVGSACFPTHAGDAGSLKRQALAHPLVSWHVKQLADPGLPEN